MKRSTIVVIAVAAAVIATGVASYASPYVVLHRLTDAANAHGRRIRRLPCVL